LKLYCSALVFAPQERVIRKIFEECIPPWIQRKSKVQANWNPILQTLEGHSRWVRSVTFSPDSKLLPTLHVLNHWLVEGTTNVLWLPTDYRPTCEAVRDKLVILGHSSGRISFLQIKRWSELIISN